MREKSLDFLGYPNYTITDDGRVFSLDYRHTGKKKEVKNTTSQFGYIILRLKNEDGRKWWFVHRLVALAFLPNTENLSQVNHKDECKTNNNLENLEWCDAKYNCNYGTRNKRMSKTQSISIKQFTKDGVFIKEYPSMKEAARKLNISQGHISSCCKGKSKSAYGYIWRYA